MSSFPLHRKYKNERSFFKILSPDAFEEILHIGSAYRRDAYKAKILPERNLIADMISLQGEHWMAISAKEYDQHLAYCEQHLQKLKGSL